MRLRVRRDFKARIRDGRLHAGISPSEEYFAIEVNHEEYRIIDDLGEPILYPKELFEVVDPSLPAGWQFLQYPDGEYHLGPTKTLVRGLYEDFFGSDGSRVAQAQAQQAVREVLEAALLAGSEQDQRLLQRDLKRLVGSRYFRD
jgi:hypothetical protein